MLNAFVYFEYIFLGEALGLHSTGIKIPLDAVSELGGRISGRGGRERLGLGHKKATPNNLLKDDLSDLLARQRSKKRKSGKRRR